MERGRKRSESERRSETEGEKMKKIDRKKDRRNQKEKEIVLWKEDFPFSSHFPQGSICLP